MVSDSVWECGVRFVSRDCAEAGFVFILCSALAANAITVSLQKV